jgi:hypothetical protein
MKFAKSWLPRRDYRKPVSRNTSSKNQALRSRSVTPRSGNAARKAVTRSDMSVGTLGQTTPADSSSRFSPGCGCPFAGKYYIEVTRHHGSGTVVHTDRILPLASSIW